MTERENHFMSSPSLQGRSAADKAGRTSAAERGTGLPAERRQFGLQAGGESHPVISLPDDYKVLDFSAGYDPEKMSEFVKNGGRGVGGYNEKRPGMYLAPHFGNRRNVHMGIDFWAPAGEPVYAVLDGEVVYTHNHADDGNYGAAVVLKHQFRDEEFYALYGHLSLKSLEESVPGKKVKAGDIVGWLGDKTENGNWPPHLHYQLSTIDPGEADMPGVVAEEEREAALKIYPDPRVILGPVY
jgi:peptidoglycan LD-endopeptidase LytH